MSTAAGNGSVKLSIQDSLLAQLPHYNMKKCKIIIDGKYMTWSGKQVFCEVQKDATQKFLSFYIEKTKETANGSNTQVAYKGGDATLSSAMRSTSINGVSLPIVVDPYYYTLDLYPSMRVAIIQTKVYLIARNIAEKQIEESKRGNTFDLNSVTFETVTPVSAKELGKFLESFLDYSRVSYRDLVYRGFNGKDSSFVMRLYKAYPFYRLLNAFVPVFIDCSLFFNPQQDNAITMTNFYKKAQETNRFVSLAKDNYTITAYFMTQEEICKEFHMEHFMRFSPQLWYDIFMGLMYSNSVFPSISRKVYIGPRTVVSYGLSQIMSPIAVGNILNKIQECKQSGNDSIVFSGRNIPLDEFIKVLGTYIERDSLYQEVESQYNSIVRSGAHILEQQRPSKETIHSILMEAKL